MISRLTSISTLCLIAFVAALFVSEPARADEVDDAVKNLLEVAKKKDGEKEAIELMVKLQDNPDSRIGAAFVKLTTSKKDDIAVSALQKASARKDPGLLKKLGGMLKNKKLPKDHPDVFVAALRAAGEYGEKKLRDPLEKVAKKYMSTEPQFAVPAILAFGRERDIEVIVTLLKFADQTNPSTGGGGATLSSDARDNLAKASAAVFEALNELTDNDIQDVKTWHEWWDENEKGYEFPDPNKVEEVVEFKKLREHTDPTYGYSVKIPGEGPTDEDEPGQFTGWMLDDPDEGINGGRFKANYTSKGEQVVRIHYVIFNTAKESIKTPEDFVKWWINDWKTNQFDPATMKPAEPEPTEMKIGGRDFSFAEAFGISAGRSSRWGPCYRRIYVTQIRHLLLYIYVDMKTGAEDDIRQQTKDIVEQMTFKDDGKGKRGRKKK